MFGLTFLNSGILAVAGTALIPLLIYLFARKKPRRVIFSSLRFIRQSQQQQKRRINIQNILLLIIRMLILLLTILAIARPALKASFLQNSTLHPKTAIALILDTSFSMDYLVNTTTELDNAKAIASQINNLLTADDRTLLLTSSKSWNDINGTLRYGPLDPALIGNVTITPLHQPMAEVIQDAARILQQSHSINQEIYVITDMQQQALPDTLDIPIFLIPTSDDSTRSNLSCEAVTVSNTIVQKNQPTRFSFDVVNHGSYPARDVLCRLILDEQTVAEKVVQLQPQQRLRDNFSVPVEQRGWHSGYVEVQNERLTMDNRNYFSFYRTLHPRVAVISDAPNLPATLETVIEIYTGNQILRLDEAQLTASGIEVFDAVILYGKTVISPRLQQVLQHYESQGKGVLYVADAALTDGVKTYLREQFGCTFQSFSASRPTRITYLNAYHPALALMPQKPRFTVNSYWQIAGNAEALMQGTSPLIVTNGTSQLWLFDPAATNSPLLLDPAFPVLTCCTLSSLNQYGMEKSHRCGETITVDGTLMLPSRQRLTLTHNRYTLLHPGLYRLNGIPFAVNVDAAESAYTRLNPATIPRITVLDEDWPNRVLRSRYGFELWKYLLLAALLLVALEMILVKSEEKRQISH